MRTINGFWLGAGIVMSINVFAYNFYWVFNNLNFEYGFYEIISGILTILFFGLAFEEQTSGVLAK